MRLTYAHVSKGATETLSLYLEEPPRRHLVTFKGHPYALPIPYVQYRFNFVRATETARKVTYLPVLSHIGLTEGPLRRFTDTVHCLPLSNIAGSGPCYTRPKARSTIGDDVVAQYLAFWAGDQNFDLYLNCTTSALWHESIVQKRYEKDWGDPDGACGGAFWDDMALVDAYFKAWENRSMANTIPLKGVSSSRWTTFMSTQAEGEPWRRRFDPGVAAWHQDYRTLRATILG